MAIEFNGVVYFTSEELRCKGSGILRLAEGFREQLLALRIAYGHPMIPTSVCRSTEYNKDVGGAPSSFHICDGERGCCAADILIPVADRRTFVQLALAMGWSIGTNRNFIHIDRRADYGFPQTVFAY